MDGAELYRFGARPNAKVRASASAVHGRRMLRIMSTISRYRHGHKAALFVVLAVFAACSPAFNWREVRPDDTALTVLLPCKPDKAQKTVPLLGKPTALRLLGCDAGGAAFAVAVADVGSAANAPAALAQWQAVTLTGMKADPNSVRRPMALPGALPTPAPVLVEARGQRADGTSVHSQALYFAQGSQVFQVVMLASQRAPDQAETFFEGVKLQ